MARYYYFHKPEKLRDTELFQLKPFPEEVQKALKASDEQKKVLTAKEEARKNFEDKYDQIDWSNNDTDT